MAIGLYIGGETLIGQRDDLRVAFHLSDEEAIELRDLFSGW